MEFWRRIDVENLRKLEPAELAKHAAAIVGMLSEIEQDLIERALRESDGNVSRCAKLLRMQRTTLIERIKKYNLKMDAA